MKPTTLFGTLLLLSTWSSVGAAGAGTYSIQKSDNSIEQRIAAALVEPVGTWLWEDLVPVNYECDHDKAQEWSREVSEAARNDKVAFCGFKAVK